MSSRKKRSIRHFIIAENICKNINFTDNNYSRISLWNTVFPDYKYVAATQNADMILGIFRRYLIGSTDTSRFCFELALFIDIEDELNSIVEVLPFPFTVAIRIALGVLRQHIEPINVHVKTDFRKIMMKRLDPEKYTEFCNIFDEFKNNISQANSYIEQIVKILDEEDLDLFFSILPPPMRLHFCLIYERPLPRIFIDFNNLSIPFEFAQAIADIDGVEASLEIMNDS